MILEICCFYFKYIKNGFGQVKCSDNQLYQVNPVRGFIEPGEAVHMNILRQNGAAKTDRLVLLLAKVSSQAVPGKSKPKKLDSLKNTTCITRKTNTNNVQIFLRAGREGRERERLVYRSREGNGPKRGGRRKEKNQNIEYHFRV